MNATAFIREVLDGIEPRTPFWISDIAEYAAEALGVNQADAGNLTQQVVTRLIAEDKVRRAERGVYYKVADPKDLNAVPFEPAVLANRYILDFKGSFIGYDNPGVLAYNLCLTETCPEKRVIATNLFTRGHQPALAQRLDIELVKPQIEVCDKNVAYLQLLDAMGHADFLSRSFGTKEDNHAACMVVKYMRANELDFGDLVGYARKAYVGGKMTLVASMLCEINLDRDGYGPLTLNRHYNCRISD